MQDPKELIAGSWEQFLPRRSLVAPYSRLGTHRDAVSWHRSRVLKPNVTDRHKLTELQGLQQNNVQ